MLLLSADLIGLRAFNRGKLAFGVCRVALMLVWTKAAYTQRNRMRQLVFLLCCVVQACVQSWFLDLLSSLLSFCGVRYDGSDATREALKAQTQPSLLTQVSALGPRYPVSLITQHHSSFPEILMKVSHRRTCAFLGICLDRLYHAMTRSLP